VYWYICGYKGVMVKEILGKESDRLAPKRQQNLWIQRIQGILRSKKGSMTVEAALIFPIIFFALLATMYVVFMIYEHAYVQSLANEAAYRGSAVWSHSERNMETGYVSVENYGLSLGDLYWRIRDSETSIDVKKE